MTHLSSNTNQRNFRFRTINVDSATANAAFDASDPALNANTSFNVDTPFRYRVEIDETNDSTGSSVGQLQYSYNSGAFTDVTGSSVELQATATAGYADGDATTDLISGSAQTFTTGSVDEVDGLPNTVPNLKLQQTEFEYCLQMIGSAVSNNDTFDLRVFNLDGYTNVGRMTAIKAAPPIGRRYQALII